MPSHAGPFAVSIIRKPQLEAACARPMDRSHWAEHPSRQSGARCLIYNRAALPHSLDVHRLRLDSRMQHPLRMRRMHRCNQNPARACNCLPPLTIGPTPRPSVCLTEMPRATDLRSLAGPDVTNEHLAQLLLPEVSPRAYVNEPREIGSARRLCQGIAQRHSERVAPLRGWIGTFFRCPAQGASFSRMNAGAILDRLKAVCLR